MQEQAFTAQAYGMVTGQKAIVNNHSVHYSHICCFYTRAFLSSPKILYLFEKTPESLIYVAYKR